MEAAARFSTVVSIAMFAALLAIQYGQRGFLPLDHSIVFAAASELLCQRVPIRDFAMPAGLSIALFQKLLFEHLGVSWLSYLIGAAALNALAAVATFGLLVPRYSTIAVPTMLALCSSVLFVPPIGTPYPDHGSFGFTIVALLFADSSRRSAHRVRWLLEMGAGFSWALAFLSKQIPAAFALPILLVMILVGRTTWWRLAASLVNTGVGALAAVTFVLRGLGLGPRGFLQGYINGPLEAGSGRVENFLAIDSPHFLHVVLPVWWFPAIAMLAVTAIAFALGAGASASRRHSLRSSFSVDLLVAWLLLFASVLYAILTFRSAWTSLGFLPPAFGLAARGLADRHGTSETTAGTGGRRHRGGLRKRVLIAVCFALGLSTAWFHLEVNETRAASLLSLRGDAPFQPMPRGLEWLDLAVPPHSSLDGGSLVDLVGYLRTNAGPLFLLGDSSILYPLSGRCSVSPVLWFHPYLTVPWSGAEATRSFQDDLIRRFESTGLRYFVVEGSGTQMGVAIQSLPIVDEWLRQRTMQHVRMGAFDVLEIRAMKP